MDRVQKFNLCCNNKPAKRLTKQWQQVMLQQLARVQEELDETIKAVKAMDELETLDGLVDIKVTADGANFLSGLPVEETFEIVMDNNDLKYFTDYDEAARHIEKMGIEYFNIQDSVVDGITYYSIHRNSDNKICKFPNFPKVDLGGLL